MRMLLAALALTAGLLPSQTAQPTTPPGKRAPTTSAKKSVNPNDAHAAIIKDFLARVDTYVALHRKFEDTLPALAKQTNPQEIDRHERALRRLIQEGRKSAKQGAIFTPAMQAVVRK